MPIQPNGTYLRQMNALAGSDLWQQRAAQANPLISASEHDAEMNDVATAISGCLKANGTTAAAADQPMGGNRHTGVGNALADDQYVSLGQAKSGLPFSQVAITANGTNPALKVTQTGAGEAFRVEDEASPDSTPFVITAAGDVGVGTATPSHKLHVPAVARLGNNLFDSGAIEINSQGSGNRASYIDFHAEDSVDYNARIIRNTGVNGSLDIIQNGTGGINVTSQAKFDVSAVSDIELTASDISITSTGTGSGLIIKAENRAIILRPADGLEIQSSTGNIAGYIKTDEESGSSNNLVLYASRTSGNAGITFRTNDGAETDQVEITNNGGHLIVHADIRANANAASDIGTSTVQFDNIYCVDLIESSDERLKNTIQDSALGLNFIKALRPVSYKYNVAQNIRGKDEEGNEIYTPREGLRPHYGLIAQEVKTAIDAAGVDFAGWKLADKNDPDSKQMLSYTQFIAPLIQAVKELSAKVETLEAEVASLKAI